MIVEMKPQTLTAILSLLTALGVEWDQFAASGQPVTWQSVLMVVAAALAGWMAKRPGDLSSEKAKQLADEHAEKAVARATVPTK